MYFIGIVIAGVLALFAFFKILFAIIAFARFAIIVPIIILIALCFYGISKLQ